MKVAMCLSGHSRNYKDNFPNYNFDADVFISSCNQSGLPLDRTRSWVSYHANINIETGLANTQDIIDLYKPKLYEFLMDTYIPKEMQIFEGCKTKTGGLLVHVGMMFYRIYRANQLKKKYEQLNNFRYDFVIRSRFDVKINEFNFNENYLYLVTSPNRTIDLFFAGKSYIMDAICECYDWFIRQKPEYLSNFGSAEEILRFYIEQLKLNQPFLNTFDITFNKDYPIQVNHIRNGIVKQIAENGSIINEGYWKQ